MNLPVTPHKMTLKHNSLIKLNLWERSTLRDAVCEWGHLWRNGPLKSLDKRAQALAELAACDVHKSPINTLNDESKHNFLDFNIFYIKFMDQQYIIFLIVCLLKNV